MTFASDSCPASSGGAAPATSTTDEPVPAASGPTDSSRAGQRNPPKQPRRPLYITPRQPDGLLMYARRIPQDILALGLYSPKATTVRLSLGTRDWLVAQPRATQLTAALDRMWADARKQRAEASPPVAAVNPRQLQRDDIPVLRQRLESLLLHCDDVDRGRRLSDEELDRYLTEFEEQQKLLRRASLRADASAVEEEAIGLLQAEDLRCDPKSEEWPLLLKSVLQGHLEALNAIAERLDGKVVATPSPPQPIRSEGDLDDLDVALQHWKSKNSPEPKTVSEMQAVVDRFKATTGRTRVSCIRPEDVIHYLNVERTRDSARGGKVNVQTVNKGIALLKALFAVVHTDYLKLRGIANPLADARKFRVKARDRARRKVFTEQQLTQLFSGPVHTACDRPAGGAGEACYWVPVLGYTSGSRMQELLQLRVTDVVELEGALMLRTETDWDADDESGEAERPTPRLHLKTAESYRLIPVHRDVLALGFREYVEWVREAGHVQLFPDVRIGVNDSWSANFSKFFNRYLRQRDIKTRMLDFVSFRHQFKTQARSLRLEQDIADYIQGHAPTRASQGYGEFPAQTLKECIDSMSFPALQRCQPWTAPQRRTRRRAVAVAGPQRG